jgi:hypothetical protein
VTKRNAKNERRPRDFYPTPEKGVLPLLPWIEQGATFVEPCAGRLDLCMHLTKHGLLCSNASDIEEINEDGLFVPAQDALTIGEDYVTGSDYIVINFFWFWGVLCFFIEYFRFLGSTWLLLDADWCHTRQSSEYMKYCQKIVSVGRLKWIPDSSSSGLDNCSWYLFQPNQCETIFHGR